MFVIDFDTDKSGVTALEESWVWKHLNPRIEAWKQAAPAGRDYRIVQTPSGGRHLYLSVTGCQGKDLSQKTDLFKTKGGDGVAVDTRGKRGYVAAYVEKDGANGYKVLNDVALADLIEVPFAELVAAGLMEDRMAGGTGGATGLATASPLAFCQTSSGDHPSASGSAFAAGAAPAFTRKSLAAWEATATGAVLAGGIPLNDNGAFEIFASSLASAVRVDGHPLAGVLEIFHRIASTFPNYDAAREERRFLSFVKDDRDDKRTFGTLEMHAGNARAAAVRHVPLPAGTVIGGGGSVSVPAGGGAWGQREVALQAVIERFVIVSVATQAKGSPGLRIYDTDTGEYLTQHGFKTAWDDRTVVDEAGTVTGSVGRLVAGDGAAQRGIRRVRDVVFSLGDPALSVMIAENGDRLFNRRKPFAGERALDEPAQVEWDTLLEYMRDVAARGDRTHYEWLWKWLAWIVQCPACKPGIAVVLQGGTGSGKSTFSAIARGLFAPYSAAYSSTALMFGQFTGHLEEHRIVGLEEALWAKDGAAADRAKDMITGDQLIVEAKGKDARAIQSAHAYVLTTNHEHAVPAMKGERRYATFAVEVVPGWGKGSQKWSALYERPGSGQIKPGLIGKLWRELSAVDLGTWCPTDDPPQTAALAQNKLESLAGGLEGMLLELVNYEAPVVGTAFDPLAGWAAGPVTLNPGTSGGKEFVLSLAARYFKQHGSPMRKAEWTDDKVLKSLRMVGGKPGRGAGGVRIWVLPKQEDARQNLADSLSVTVADLDARRGD